MAMKRKTGTYYIDGLSAKSNKHLFSKNYNSVNEAIKVAKDWQKKGKIVQAQIMFTKDILSDVEVWGLNTKGIVKRYNKEKGVFEKWQ